VEQPAISEIPVENHDSIKLHVKHSRKDLVSDEHNNQLFKPAYFKRLAAWLRSTAAQSIFLWWTSLTKQTTYFCWSSIL